MKRIYSLFQRKGGGTKTTTAAELVLAAAQAGHRVLAIDVDTACALTVRMGFKLYDADDLTVADYLAGAPLGDCVAPSPIIDGVDVMRGGTDLDELSDRSVTKFRDSLAGLEDYDLAVIDTPGTYGRIVRAALAAADTVVVPMPAEGEPLLMLPQMKQWQEKHIAPLRRGRGPQETWFVPTKIDSRQRLDRQMIDVLEQQAPGRVTPPVRIVGTSVTTSFLNYQPIGLYAPEDAVSADYRAAMAPLIDGL